MARKPNLIPTDGVIEADLPPWWNPQLHRVEARGIVATATGDLLAEDGLPVNAAARAAWLETDTAEAAAIAAQPAANQE